MIRTTTIITLYICMTTLVACGPSGPEAGPQASSGAGSEAGTVSIIEQEHELSIMASSCEPRSFPQPCIEHVESQGIKYTSEVFEGKSRVTTSHRDADGTSGPHEVVDGEQPIREGESFSREFEASVAGGSSVRANLSTTTTHGEDEFLITGRFNLQTEHAQGDGWGGVSRAEAHFWIMLVIGKSSTVHIEGCEMIEVEAASMEAVSTGGHRCEYRSILDDEAFESLHNQDYSMMSDHVEPEQLEYIRRFPKGDSIYFTLHSTSFSSAESHTGDQSGEFEIRITWD